MSNDVFILSAVRTAIGTFGGSLKDHSPTKLGAIVVKEAIRRANLEPGHVDHSVFGHVIPTEAADLFLGRTAAIEGGMRGR